MYWFGEEEEFFTQVLLMETLIYFRILSVVECKKFIGRNF
jgi:hypothetical protein